jgi:hypothetical protein
LRRHVLSVMMVALNVPATVTVTLTATMTVTVTD